MSSARRRSGARRVIVVEQYAAFGEALSQVLNGQGYRSSYAGPPPARATVSAVRRAPPDLVVVGADPADAAAEQLSVIAGLTTVGVPVVALANHPDHQVWRHMLSSAGARAVVRRTDSLAHLVDVVTAVVEGTFDDGSAHALHELSSGERARQELAERLVRLTPRERELLGQLQLGRTAGQIATLDHVAESTVRAQITTILRKLEVSSQVAAVALFRWLSDPGERGGAT